VISLSIVGLISGCAVDGDELQEEEDTAETESELASGSPKAPSCVSHTRSCWAQNKGITCDYTITNNCSSSQGVGLDNPLSRDSKCVRLGPGQRTIIRQNSQARKVKSC
jgi:hypothetical protein